MTTFIRRSVIVTVLLSLVVLPSPARAQNRPGQSATLLPDGRWLLLGGQGLGGPVATALLQDPQTGVTTTLPNSLGQPRAGHSATLLPDGTVLILGGQGAGGPIVVQSELFHIPTQAFETLATPTMLTPRAYHTATLLTDGQVLITGGISGAGQTLSTAELWGSKSQNAEAIPTQLATPRQSATAELLGDGSVLIWGGRAQDGSAIQTGEVFDPIQQRFTVASTPPLGADASLPEVTAAIPGSGAANVPIDSAVALRFSKPLRVDTVNDTTVTLTGPQGSQSVVVVPAEGGSLAFVTPQNALTPGATYTLTLNGVTDPEGVLVPFTTIQFNTQPTTPTAQSGSIRSATPVAATQSGATPPSRADAVQSGDGPWQGPMRDGKPVSPWQSMPPFQARPGVTALAGQVLRLDGDPLPDVTIGIGTQTARTDKTGRFLLTGIPAGHQAFLIDGRTASRSGRTYGVFESGVDLTAGRTTVLPYTSWMPQIDTAHAISIPSPTARDVVITSPRIPGLELHIPSGTIVRDHEGQVARQVSLTQIPLDRTPFPLPKNVVVPLYFTAQPGAGYLQAPAGKKAFVVYPNHTIQPPGARFNFWDYSADGVGWHIYGMGTVTPDGRQIKPDPGVGIYEFSGAMINDGEAPPTTWPGVTGPFGADPVDLGTGLFVVKKTDLTVKDVLPLVLSRVYRPGDANSRAFGIGATHPYAMFLWSAQQYQQADLILPDGGRIHYVRTSTGTGFTDAVFQHTMTPTVFYGSQIAWNGNGWNLTLKDGTVYVFGENAPLQAIRDRYGNQLTLTRTNGQSGNITRITSPNGRWLQFTYDASNRITQAQDLAGRTVTYTYDTSGRLASVTDPNGGVTQYTYDSSHRMLTLTDARGITFLTNTYDANGRVTQQSQADQTTFQMAYSLDSNGKVTQTNLTDPRGTVRQVTFNADGYALTDTLALGAPEQQTTTYVRQAGSDFVQSATDALTRQTAYTYDTMGNVTSVTRLAGTPQAVTTTFAYESTFNQVTSIADPLSHSTTFGYDSSGHLTTITNALGKQTMFTYNSQGQPLTMTDPLSHTWQFSYDTGDLVSVTDPLGNTTTRFTDAVGRLVGLTSPLGRRTRYDYGPLNALTRITDPIGGQTQFNYDGNGNLLSLTDALSNMTTYAYNNMDQATSRTDPLSHAETYAYDNNGNPTRFTDRKSQVTSTTYNALDRPTLVTYQDSSTTAYTWDAGNRLTQLVDSISGTITRTYDGLDRLTQEVTPQGTISYAYDAEGRRTSMTVQGQTAVTYTYDNADRLTQIAQGSATVTIAYDNINRRTSLTLPNGIVTEYSYDAASRLTGLTYKLSGTTIGTLTYSYDAEGNRTAVGGTWARTSLPAALTSATYNAANQQTAFGGTTQTFDLNGNLTSDGTNTYTWDVRNRLASLSGGATASFQYDPLGRRTSKTINGTQTGFLYDGLNPVQELNGTTPTANLLTGLAIDEYLTRTASGTQTFVADGLASTIALTDNSGVVQASYTYEPFGATSSSGTPGSNTFTFTGREDDGTGLKYYRARYYRPMLGRFTSEDPLGLEQNVYAYVRNSPALFADPLGLKAWFLGASFSGGLGASGTSSGGLVIDDSWQVGWATTLGTGSTISVPNANTGLEGASGLVVFQSSTAATIDKLGGWSWYGDVTVGAPIPVATPYGTLPIPFVTQTNGSIGTAAPKGPATGPATAGFGLGLGTPGVSVSSGFAYTDVRCLFNCKDRSRASKSSR
jgi:RHS repeat-associated protein